MLESKLQRIIEGLYRIDGTLSVADFCIDDHTLRIMLGDVAHRETLVVRHDGEYTDLALFIEEDVLSRARAFLEEGGLDLDAFCAATEGVSHFVYFTFCGAQLERPVSQIELELQAEIDKFLLLRLHAPSGEDLVTKLFEEIRLAAHLSTDQQERYLVANRAARRYARWLDGQIARGNVASALDDARRLYRKPLTAKLERIARAA